MNQAPHRPFKHQLLTAELLLPQNTSQAVKYIHKFKSQVERGQKTEAWKRRIATPGLQPQQPSGCGFQPEGSATNLETVSPACLHFEGIFSSKTEISRNSRGHTLQARGEVRLSKARHSRYPVPELKQNSICSRFHSQKPFLLSIWFLHMKDWTNEWCYYAIEYANIK